MKVQVQMNVTIILLQQICHERLQRQYNKCFYCHHPRSHFVGYLKLKVASIHYSRPLFSFYDLSYVTIFADKPHKILLLVCRCKSLSQSCKSVNLFNIFASHKPKLPPLTNSSACSLAVHIQSFISNCSTL